MKPKFIFFTVLFVCGWMVFALPQIALAESPKPYASTQAAAVPQSQPTIATPSLTVNPSATPLTTDTTLETFIASVTSVKRSGLVGIYVAGVMAYPVVQQPTGNMNYVAEKEDVVTQYGPPEKDNVIGILAHNYLAGEDFFRLKADDVVILVYGDGSQLKYRIQAIDQFQALNPDNPYSSFVEVNTAAQATLDFRQVYEKYYANSGHLIFQTCIDAYNNDSWGRLFITAEPI